MTCLGRYAKSISAAGKHVLRRTRKIVAGTGYARVGRGAGTVHQTARAILERNAETINASGRSFLRMGRSVLKARSVLRVIASLATAALLGCAVERILNARAGRYAKIMRVRCRERTVVTAHLVGSALQTSRNTAIMEIGSMRVQHAVARKAVYARWRANARGWIVRMEPPAIAAPTTSRTFAWRGRW